MTVCSFKKHRDCKRSVTGIRRLALGAAVLALLGGCAGNGVKPDASVDKNALYEGRPTVTFRGLPQAGTVDQAIQFGDQARRASQLDEALYHYIQGLQLDARNGEAYYRIGLVHAQRQNLPLAERALRSALAVKSDHVGALEALGLLHLSRNDYAQAKSLLQRALEADLARTGGSDSLTHHDQQSPARAYNGLGVIADLDGDHDRAKALYQASLAIRPGSAEVLNNLAYSLYLQKDWQAAERLFRQALQQDAKFHQAWRNLGLLYTRQQRYDAALGAFEQIMESAEAHNDIGYICMLDGRYGLAENYFNRALSLSPVYYKKAQENLTHVQRMQQNQISQR